jgi:hypothetical protein
VNMKARVPSAPIGTGRRRESDTSCLGNNVYTTDSTYDSVDLVTGPFRTDQPLVVAIPCGATSAPRPARLRLTIRQTTSPH